jgi:adenylosuccinate synthase
MRHPTIVGLQYGDEGKGKVTDFLAKEAKWVIRFNGGNNAGHTIILNGKKLVTHAVPSGVLYDHVKNYIGAGCVVDPTALRKELDEISAASVTLGPDRLRIDYRAHLILPVHLEMDALRESGSLGIGTTKRGIGPTYLSKVDRVGLRVGDLLNHSWIQKLDNILKVYVPLLKDINPGEFLARNQKWIEEARKWILPYIETEPAFFYDIARNQKCVLEGAQGILLDVDHGSYPFVTSSNTLASQGVAGGPFPLSCMGAVVGIAKAYVTRVGQGELKTELSDETGERIRKNGGEFGATTGRPRRVGWLDLDELKSAVRLTDCSYIVLTKGDVLSGEPIVRLKKEGKLIDFEAWPQAQEGPKLHPNFEKYCRFVEDFVGCPIIAVGTGADRAAIVWRHQVEYWKAQ